MFNTTKILDKITQYSIRALVFLIPLFFLSIGPQALDFHKQALLVLLTMVGLTAFALKSLVEKKLKIKSPFLSSVALVFLLALSVSTIFSWDSVQSFFGPVGMASSGLLTWLSLVTLFFLIVNSFDSVAEAENLVWVGMSSGFVAALLGFLQAYNLSLLPWDFAQAQGFNTIGTFNSLGLFMAALVPLIISLFLVKKKTFYKAGLAILGTLSFLILVLANYWVAWVCLGIGMISLIVLFKISSTHVKSNAVILPVVILVIAFSFALIQPQLPGVPNPSTEISLSYNSTFEIGSKIVSGDQGIGKAITGSGPGTFTMLYSLFKPKEISQSIWWTVSFQRAPSQILELMGTTGILGVLAMLGLIFSFGTVSIKKIVSRERSKFNSERALEVGLASGWLILAAGKFLYPTALSVEFLFWLFMGLFVIITFSNK